MPDRRYIAGHNPPNLTDRILAHSAELAVILLGCILGPLVSIGALLPGEHPTPALAGLGLVPTLLLGVSVACGSALWGVSILRHYEDLADMWRTMRLGMGLAGSGWAGAALAALVEHPSWASTWITCTGVATICAVGLWSTVLTERRLRALVQEVHDR